VAPRDTQLGQQRGRVRQHLERGPLEHEAQLARRGQRNHEVGAAAAGSRDPHAVPLEQHRRRRLVAHHAPHLVEDGAEGRLLRGRAEQGARHLEQALVEDAVVLLAGVDADVLDGQGHGAGEGDHVAGVVGGEAARLVEGVEQGHDAALSLDGDGEYRLHAALPDRRVVEGIALRLVREVGLLGLDDVGGGGGGLEREAVLRHRLGPAGVGGPAGHDLPPGAVVEGEVAALRPQGRRHATGDGLVTVPDFFAEKEEGRIVQLQRFIPPVSTVTSGPEPSHPEGEPLSSPAGWTFSGACGNNRSGRHAPPTLPRRSRGKDY
jgi:hypothetical protein